MRPLAAPDALPDGQMSLAIRVSDQRGRHPRPAGRGRGREAARRAYGALPEVARVDAAEGWSAFVIETCGTREDCAVLFGVTFQCACNWFEGWSAPAGQHVMAGAVMFPAAFRRMLAQVGA